MPEGRIFEQEQARTGRKRYLCFVRKDAKRGMPPCHNVTIAGITFAVANDKPRHDEADPHARSLGHPNWISATQWEEFERIVDYHAVRWLPVTGPQVIKTTTPTYAPDHDDVSIRPYLAWKEWPEGEERFEDGGVSVELAKDSGARTLATIVA